MFSQEQRWEWAISRRRDQHPDRFPLMSPVEYEMFSGDPWGKDRNGKGTAGYALAVEY